MIDDEKRNFRAGRRCVDLIFILIRYVRKHKRKKCRVYVRFIDLENAYDRVNREAL